MVLPQPLEGRLRLAVGLLGLPGGPAHDRRRVRVELLDGFADAVGDDADPTPDRRLHDLADRAAANAARGLRSQRRAVRGDLSRVLVQLTGGRAERGRVDLE